MGLTVEEDDSGPVVGSEAGQPARPDPRARPESILLCAHMDTVPLAAPRGAGARRRRAGRTPTTAILGADNKSAIAVILELARRVTAGAPPPPVGHRGPVHRLRGGLAARLTGVRRLAAAAARSATSSTTPRRSARSSSPRPPTTGSSPSSAGAPPTPGYAPRPGAARSWPPPTPSRPCGWGGWTPRRPPTSGIIDGGSAINVIPERCRIEAEVRSLDPDRAAAVTTETVDHLQDAANAGECDLDVNVERMFSGYRTKPRAPQLAVAERALRACGYEPRQIASGGASDANSFEAAGFRLHLPGRRDRAQPRARRADQRPGAGGLLDDRDHPPRRGRGRSLPPPRPPAPSDTERVR